MNTQKEDMEKVFLYDCTLRDGEQGEGLSLSIKDKLRIAARLDAFGIDYIEGGFPASNPKDMEFFKRIGKMQLRNAKIVAFGMVCKKDTQAHDDPAIQSLLACGAPVIAIVGKTSVSHVENVLQTNVQENLRMIQDSVSYLVSQGKEVCFDAEHFFDGYKENAHYALACLKTAHQAGATWVCLCDTNGGTLTLECARIIETVCAAIPGIRIAIHTHNDSGLAVANACAAIEAGARCIQGTINGIGERTGNANLLTCAANLHFKTPFSCLSEDSMASLTSVASFVAETCNCSLPANQPYVGSSAFAHKGGLHASALSRLEFAYEHVNPELVGNGRKMLVSELAGKASLVAKAASLGIDLSNHEDKVADILEAIKRNEAQGYSYEVADGSLVLLIQRYLGTYMPHFTLESFRVIVDDYEDTGAFAKDAMSEATIKIHVGDERFVATGEGVGPVGALDNALRLAISSAYPQVASMELVDFKVRILDENVGTDAITRVGILTSDGVHSWGSIGVSENILEASWNALVDAIEFGLMKAGV